MQALRRVLAVSLGVVALGCGSSTGPAASRNNPGTGTNTLLVTADIDANDDPTAVGGYTTDYSVSLRDGLGNKVSGGAVTIGTSSGMLTLPETATGSGDYFLTGTGFPGGDFTLNVVHAADTVRNVVLGGPGKHVITAPQANATVSANQPLTVRWSVPSRATQAEVETRDFGPAAVPDTGAYVIAGVDNPPNASQRIRVFRYNEVNIAGGLLGSRMRVQVRATVEPVIVQ